MRNVTRARPTASVVVRRTVLPPKATATDAAFGKPSAEQLVATLALCAGTVVTSQLSFAACSLVGCGTYAAPATCALPFASRVSPQRMSCRPVQALAGVSIGAGGGSRVCHASALG